MIEPKQITVDEMTFYLQPLKPLKALRLDKQILSLLLPALGGALGKVDLKDLDLESIDLETITSGLSTSLQQMDGDAFEKFVIALFEGVQYMEGNKPPQELNEDLINILFRGKLFSIYKLLFETMKFNKFTPFELVGGGNLMERISTSVNPDKKKKTPGKKSGPLANSLVP